MTSMKFEARVSRRAALRLIATSALPATMLLGVPDFGDPVFRLVRQALDGALGPSALIGLDFGDVWSALQGTLVSVDRKILYGTAATGMRDDAALADCTTWLLRRIWADGMREGGTVFRRAVIVLAGNPSRIKLSGTREVGRATKKMLPPNSCWLLGAYHDMDLADELRVSVIAA